MIQEVPSNPEDAITTPATELSAPPQPEIKPIEQQQKMTDIMEGLKKKYPHSFKENTRSNGKTYLSLKGTDTPSYIIFTDKGCFQIQAEGNAHYSNFDIEPLLVRIDEGIHNPPFGECYRIINLRDRVVSKYEKIYMRGFERNLEDPQYQQALKNRLQEVELYQKSKAEQAKPKPKSLTAQEILDNL